MQMPRGFDNLHCIEILKIRFDVSKNLKEDDVKQILILKIYSIKMQSKVLNKCP